MVKLDHMITGFRAWLYIVLFVIATGLIGIEIKIIAEQAQAQVDLNDLALRTSAEQAKIEAQNKQFSEQVQSPKQETAAQLQKTEYLHFLSPQNGKFCIGTTIPIEWEGSRSDIGEVTIRIGNGEIIGTFPLWNSKERGKSSGEFLWQVGTTLSGRAISAGDNYVINISASLHVADEDIFLQDTSKTFSLADCSH